MTTRDNAIGAMDLYASESHLLGTQQANAAVQPLLDSLNAQVSALTAQLATAMAPVPFKPRVPYPTTGGPAGDIVSGRLVIKDSGVVLDGFDISAWVQIKAKNITIKRSTVRGTNSVVLTSGLIECISTAAVGTVLEDLLLVPQTPQLVIDGVFGHDFTARRVEVMHTVDGFGIAGDNVLIEDPYVHDLVYLSPDPSHASDKVPGVHADCIQVHFGHNVHILRGRLMAFFAPYLGDVMRQFKTEANAQGGWNSHWSDIKDYRLQTNAGMMISQRTGEATDVLVEDTFIDGGAVGINCAPDATWKPGAVKLKNVVWGGHTMYGQNTKDPSRAIQVVS